MITTSKKTANAVGGKTARACDSCLLKRARWYCPADDAFLCQLCDSSVHSANQLASRHERVRLETASNKTTDSNYSSSPPWLKGFTRKPRTPRHHKSKNSKKNVNPLPLVPEIGIEEGSTDENDQEQLLYRVPVYDPFDTELCNVPNERIEDSIGSELDVFLNENGRVEPCDFDTIHGFLPSDMDLAEFAADVESLLGKGLDENLCGIESLGLLNCKEEDADIDTCIGGRRVKVEDDELGACLDSHLDPVLDGARDTMDWNFDYDFPVTETVEKRKLLLRLDYKGVINAWDGQRSPWTTGTKPEFNPDNGWPDFMGTCDAETSHPYGGPGKRMGGSGGDGEREARVLRYREKRRTRLFSKKIRYEVRKLNAEKRPRMKGRFVKRTTFGGGANFPYLMKK